MELIDLIGPDPEATIERNQIRRTTVDGVTMVSIYDVMQYVCSVKNTRQTWSNLKNNFPEISPNNCQRALSRLPGDRQLVQKYQFPGPGQRDTPIGDIHTIIHILMNLGPNSDRVRNLLTQLVLTGFDALDGDFSSLERPTKRKRPQEGHVYIVRLAQHELTDAPIWKVGMSVQGLDKQGKLRRLKAYGFGSKEYCCIPVENARETETRILKRLRSLGDFESMEEYGSEYFKGDLGRLIAVVHEKSRE